MKEITPALPGTKLERLKRKSASEFLVTVCSSESWKSDVLASAENSLTVKMSFFFFFSPTQNHVPGKPDHYGDGGADQVDVRSHRRPDTQHYVELRYARLRRGRAGIRPYLSRSLRDSQ